MRILTLIKRVPAPGARINITDDEQSVNTANLGFTMSPHEECAVEGAVQLIEEHGGESTVLTLGCLLYTSPSPRDQRGSRMPSSA